MTENRTTRALRAAVFTALAVPLAALGQVVITGRALPLTLVLAASAAVFVLAVGLSGTRRGFLQISAVLLPVELLLNTAFNLGQDSCTAAAQGHGVSLLVCGGGSLGGHTPFSGLGESSVQLLVLLAHLALALVAAAWLDRGDAALARVVRSARTVRSLACAPLRALRLLAPLAAVPGVLAPARETDRTPARPESVLLSPAPRRGPPAVALAC